uniref:Phospholipase B-like n=1 Tax=Pyrodinium bahamense TaxID=73915 RepID=A0A7S0B860_9DINO
MAQAILAKARLRCKWCVFQLTLALLVIAMLSRETAQQLEEDLLQAFNARDFQLQLLVLRQTRYPNANALAAAIRETAMVAQMDVLVRYNFMPNALGVAEMAQSLASHYVRHEGLGIADAFTKAKALCVGMTSGHQQGWSWPGLWAATDDAASTNVPGTDCDDLAFFSDADTDLFTD